MGYIIVWRDRYKEPHIDLNEFGFKEEYYSYEDAKESAENTLKAENENEKSPWYFDYKIYQESNS